ncbi:hypothetical protein BV898_18203 [Hypsibius exemplaris]|uniref:Uncharacterized protein n=1 Tax=Hypsibius exemplaris TaxID=2072580 RepID=A0A9X6RN95_HYPEX|nr:hypothetical protein BV898_18203 [Hypsibius exemplaris]
MLFDWVHVVECLHRRNRSARWGFSEVTLRTSSGMLELVVAASTRALMGNTKETTDAASAAGIVDGVKSNGLAVNVEFQ